MYRWNLDCDNASPYRNLFIKFTSQEDSFMHEAVCVGNVPRIFFRSVCLWFSAIAPLQPRDGWCPQICKARSHCLVSPSFPGVSVSVCLPLCILIVLSEYEDGSSGGP